MARTQEELDRTRMELLQFTPEVWARSLNLLLPDSAQQLATEAADRWGGLDILVTNAGAGAPGNFLDLDNST